MPALSEGAKQRLMIVINFTKTIFHYGFIPTVLYLGLLLKKQQASQDFNDFFLGIKKGADPGMPEITYAK